MSEQLRNFDEEPRHELLDGEKHYLGKIIVVNFPEQPTKDDLSHIENDPTAYMSGMTGNPVVHGAEGEPDTLEF